MAEKVGFPDALQVLDKVKNYLFGDADKVETLAQAWAENIVISEARGTISQATHSLQGYWSGPAFDQFSAYNSDVISALDADQATVAGLGNALANCVTIVYDTYGAALRFIGETAASLAGLILDLAAIPVPVVGEVTVVNSIDDAKSILTDFIRNVTNLLADALHLIGQYKSASISFISMGANFKVVSLPPEQIGTTGSWHVKPYS
ncbi:hypothetical protein [Amycolatopsis benzoatilytica]|uniref:hypothetical protein n=1 Tax=Amycolatopsis benzoatilytica TaxID=346045 RepID=UPI00037D9894|nr:hypothetical protein [Amycolatopsis benzoatilytica]